MQTDKWVSEYIASVNAQTASKTESQTATNKTETSLLKTVSTMFHSIKKNLNPYTMKHA